MTNTAKITPIPDGQRGSKTAINTFFGKWPEELNHADLPDEVKGLGNVVAASKFVFHSLYETHQQAMADETIPEAGRLAKSAQFAKDRLEEVRKAHAISSAKASKKMDQLVAEMQSMFAPGSAGQETRRMEARGYLRSLPSDERMRLIQSGDPDMLDAVVTASAALSGIEGAVHDDLKKKYIEQKAPDLSICLGTIATGIEKADRALASLEHETAKLIDFAQADAVLERAGKETTGYRPQSVREY